MQIGWCGGGGKGTSPFAPTGSPSAGRPAHNCPRLSPQVTPPVPGEKREVVQVGGGGPSALARRERPVARELEAPVSQTESSGSPSPLARGGIRAETGVTEHFLLPAGAPGLLRGLDSGSGWGNPRTAPPPLGPAAGRLLGLPCARHHPPSPRAPSLGSQPLASAPPRPGAAPGLTLSLRVPLQRERCREARARRLHVDHEWGSLREGAEAGNALCIEPGWVWIAGCTGRLDRWVEGILPHPSSGSQPALCSWSIPCWTMQRRGGGVVPVSSP